MTTLIVICNARIKKPFWKLWFTVKIKICYLQIAISLGPTPGVILERTPRISQCVLHYFMIFGIEIRLSLLMAQGTRIRLGSGTLGAEIIVSYVLIGKTLKTRTTFSPVEMKDKLARDSCLSHSLHKSTNLKKHLLIITRRAKGTLY